MQIRPGGGNRAYNQTMVHVKFLGTALVVLMIIVNSCGNVIDRKTAKFFTIIRSSNEFTSDELGKAVKLLNDIIAAKAEDSSKAEAYFYLSHFDSGLDQSQRNEYLLKAANYRYGHACDEVGKDYMYGINGFPKDEEKAISYLQYGENPVELAYYYWKKGDDAWALKYTKDIYDDTNMELLGIFYYEGKVVERDLEKARDYLCLKNHGYYHFTYSRPLINPCDTTGMEHKDLKAKKYFYLGNLQLAPDKEIISGFKDSPFQLINKVYNAHYYYRSAQIYGKLPIDLSPAISILENILLTFAEYVEDGNKIVFGDYFLRRTQQAWRMSSSCYGEENGWYIRKSSSKSSAHALIYGRQTDKYHRQYSNIVSGYSIYASVSEDYDELDMYFGTLRYRRTSYWDMHIDNNHGICYKNDGSVINY